MTIAAHYGAAFTPPNNIIFMAADTFLMKGRQERDRNLFCQSIFMAAGTFASFALIPVGVYIEVVVADSAANNHFVQIVVEPYRMLIVLGEFPAF